MSFDEDLTARPAVILVASGLQPAALRLPPNVSLGRRVAVGDTTHELVDERMSRDHAIVSWERGVWRVEDLDSRNGTFLDGERVSSDLRRRGDAVLRLGHTVFLLLADGGDHPAPEDAVVGPELERAYTQLRLLSSGSALAVEGEAGTGKELAARMFHERGPRAKGPFVEASCSAMPEGMAERLIFGGKRGAAETIGHMTMARGGTLFLDEIADLDLTAQAALVKWLTGPRDTGLVIGGNLLRGAVTEGKLRPDLLEKVGPPVKLPPLRSRLVDIARIIQREVRPLAAHPKLIESCLLRKWPGNVTELRGALRSAKAAAVEAQREVIRVEDLPEGAGMPPGTASGETAVERNKPATLLDRATIADAMQRASGVVTVAARLLGVHRRQLYKLLDEFEIAYDAD